MGRATDLLKMRITYDIVVSDFGREAAIEYLHLVATKERRLIQAILKPEGLEFFDEYRRIMFTAIGDLAYFKERAIAESIVSKGCLTEDILIGLGPSPMSQDFVDRVAVSVVHEVLGAMDRGHDVFRVMVPCNGLSVLARELTQVISSVAELKRVVGTYAPRTSGVERLATAHIRVRTVPEAVIRSIAATKRPQRQKLRLLVLGTRGVNAIYGSFAGCDGISVLALEDWEYDLIDKAIVASIGGDQALVDLCRDQILEKLVRPRQEAVHDIVIVEACTDFRFGIGLSSLEVFADAMVNDCYQTPTV